MFREREKDRSVSRDVLASLIGSTFRPEIVNAPAHARRPVLYVTGDNIPSHHFPFLVLLFLFLHRHFADSRRRTSSNKPYKMSRERAVRSNRRNFSVTSCRVSLYKFRASKDVKLKPENFDFPRLLDRNPPSPRAEKLEPRSFALEGGINKFRGRNRLARSYRVCVWGRWERGWVRVVCKTRAGQISA